MPRWSSFKAVRGFPIFLSRRKANQVARATHGNGGKGEKSFSLAVANITSLHNKYALVAEHAGQGILAMCESNHTPSLRKQIDAEMAARRAGSSEVAAHFHYGADRAGPRSAGVALAASPAFGKRIEQLPPPTNEAAEFVAEGRLGAFAVSCSVPARTRTDPGEAIFYLFVAHGDAANRE